MDERWTHTAYVALGSNLGDRAAMLQRALEQIEADESTAVDGVSGVYETASYADPRHPDFLNACVRLITCRSPGGLLECLLSVERALGRVRRERWGPRTIDLDLLLFDDLQVDESHLKVPHPEMERRRFVLIPLADIAADHVHPLQAKTVRQLLVDCPDQTRTEPTRIELWNRR